MPTQQDPPSLTGDHDPSQDRCALANAHALLSRVFDAVGACSLVLDTSCIIRRADGHTSALIGTKADAFIGRPVTEVIQLPSHLSGMPIQHLCRALVEMPPSEASLLCADGTRHPVVLTTSPLRRPDGVSEGVVVVGIDQRDQRERAMAHSHSQKLESVGQLASGIAHEINTPIQFIGDSVRFLQDAFGSYRTVFEALDSVRRAAKNGGVPDNLLDAVDLEENEQDLEFLQEEIPEATRQALEGIDRVSQIVRAMRSFAHPTQSSRVPHDLNDAVRTMLTVARNEYKYVADVETDLSPLPDLVCNVGEINQVLLNLVINAAHAIEDLVGNSGERGLITIATRHIDDSIQISITDTGIGIPTNVRQRIFDPFFTTKEVGRGTGQGLAVVHRIIVETYKGEIKVDSTPGVRTQVTLKLPLGRKRH